MSEGRDRINLLEEKVHKTVEKLMSLHNENKTLKSKIASYQKKITELEDSIKNFKKEQSDIQQGIISALKYIDSIEDAVEEFKIDDVNRGEDDAVIVDTDFDKI